VGNKSMAWLIGTKVVCCGALLLVLTGALSLGTIGTFLSGNALPLAGGGVLALVLALRWLYRRAPMPLRRRLRSDLPPEQNRRIARDA
jgi:uncharacterized membrane protein